MATVKDDDYQPTVHHTIVVHLTEDESSVAAAERRRPTVVTDCEIVEIVVDADAAEERPPHTAATTGCGIVEMVDDDGDSASQHSADRRRPSVDEDDKLLEAIGRNRGRYVSLRTADGHPSDEIVEIREEDAADDEADGGGDESCNSCVIDCLYVSSKFCGCTIM